MKHGKYNKEPNMVRTKKKCWNYSLINNEKFSRGAQ